MADKKITQLTALTTPANNDLLLIVDDPSGSPISKKVTLGDIFGETAQTVFQTIDIKSTGNATLSGNNVVIEGANLLEFKGNADFNSDNIRIRTTKTPGSSNNLIENLPVGTLAWDTDYLYIAISSSVIKRITLDTF